VNTLLIYRPSIEDMQLILEPMCYLFRNDAVKDIIYDKKKGILYNAYKHGKTGKAFEYQKQLSIQLIEYFIEKYSQVLERSSSRYR
jgi:hypothetical protein